MLISLRDTFLAYEYALIPFSGEFSPQSQRIDRLNLDEIPVTVSDNPF